MSQALATEDRVDQRISAAVRGLIAQRRLTVAEVGRLVGMSRTTLYKRINNENAWEADEVDRLARFFGVSRDSLYEGRAEFVSGGTATVAAGARSSTDRASDYGSRVGHFQRPRRDRRRRRDWQGTATPLHLRVVCGEDVA